MYRLRGASHTGKKYQAEGFGKYEETGWNVHQKKRVEIN